jgi:hypothetical protein
MARIGYCRTSTDRQELGRQQKTLNASGCDQIFEETASGNMLGLPLFFAAPQIVEPRWYYHRIPFCYFRLE